MDCQLSPGIGLIRGQCWIEGAIHSFLYFSQQIVFYEVFNYPWYCTCMERTTQVGGGYIRSAVLKMGFLWTWTALPKCTLGAPKEAWYKYKGGLVDVQWSQMRCAPLIDLGKHSAYDCCVNVTDPKMESIFKECSSHFSGGCLKNIVCWWCATYM